MAAVRAVNVKKLIPEKIQKYLTESLISELKAMTKPEASRIWTKEMISSNRSTYPVH